MGQAPARARRGPGAGAALRLPRRNRCRRRTSQGSRSMKLASTDITADSATADAVRLRPFQPSDVPAAHALSSALNWPHRIEDWQLALSLGQGVVAERDGKVLGTALSWLWGANYATIGPRDCRARTAGTAYRLAHDGCLARSLGNAGCAVACDRCGARRVRAPGISSPQGRSTSIRACLRTSLR